MSIVETGAGRLQRLRGRASRDGAPVAVVAAHPDDEVVSAAAALLSIPRVYVIHVTDGAPRNMVDAARLGFAAAADYACTRRAEAQAALAICGIGADRMIGLGFPDQEAALNLAGMTRRLGREFGAIRPGLILTHAYEGGHPDHDAAAFGVHAAVRVMHQTVESRAPAIVEFASYHAQGEGIALLEFLPGETEVVSVSLSGRERELKRTMIAAHVTQAGTIAGFPADRECFRPAPEYDFTSPPHESVLHYERHDWGMSGERFRVLAAAALVQLGLQSPV